MFGKLWQLKMLQKKPNCYKITDLTEIDKKQIIAYSSNLEATTTRLRTTPFIPKVKKDDELYNPTAVHAETEERKWQFSDEDVSMAWASTMRKEAFEIMLAERKRPNWTPRNEMETIALFIRVESQIGWELLQMKSNTYPDAIYRDTFANNKTVMVEFEFLSKNFNTHGHDSRGADLVICWENNHDLDIPTIALSDYYSPSRQEWDTIGLSDALRFSR